MGHLARLEADGFSVVESVFDSAEVRSMIDKLESAIAADDASSIKSRGKVYAARNLIDSIPDIQSCYRAAPLMELLTEDLSARLRHCRNSGQLAHPRYLPGAS